MHFIGYLVTLSNLHNLAGGSLNEMSLHVGTLQSIVDEAQNVPFPLEGFRQNGYQRIGAIGIYLSKNVQNFLFYHQGNPDDEGIMLKLYFNDPDSQESGEVPESGRQTVFLHRQPVSDDVQHVINTYAQTGAWPDQVAAN